MVLHRHYRRLGVQRSIRVAQPQNVGKLQRRRAGKQNFAGGAKFDDGAFLHARATRQAAMTRAVNHAAVTRTVASRELHGNAYRRGFGKKAGQICNRAGLPSPRLPCALLPQAMKPFSGPVLLRKPAIPTEAYASEGSASTVEEPARCVHLNAWLAPLLPG